MAKTNDGSGRSIEAAGVAGVENSRPLDTGIAGAALRASSLVSGVVPGPVPGVVSLHPFIYQIKPRWGDTDIARIVYTGKIPDYGLMAIEAWAEARLGKNWYEFSLDWGFGTPFVSLSLDFKSPMSPRDVVLVHVFIDRIGTKSLTFRVEGRRQSNDDLCFDGRYTCVCIDASKRPDLVTIPLDPRLRAAAEQG